MGAAVAASTQRKPASAFPLHSRGVLQHPKGLSLPLEWSSRFSLPLALKERNAAGSLNFVPFWDSPVFRRTISAAGGIG